LNHDPASTTSRGHRWLMALMCAPMLLIVGLLIATGAVGAGALLPALLCVGGMAFMMFVMGRTRRS